MRKDLLEFVGAVSLTLMMLASRGEAALGCFNAGGGFIFATCSVTADCAPVGGVDCTTDICLCDTPQIFCPCLQTCGDGVVTGTETCDPPGSFPPPNQNICRQDCLFCGDGVVNGGGIETCDDANSNNNDACRNDCTRHLRNDPAVIRYRTGQQVNDRLWVHGNFENDHVVDSTNLVVGVRLTNANGIVYSAEVPLGAVNVRKMKGEVRKVFRFADPSARTRPDGGIVVFKVVKDRRWYRVNVWARGDFSAATSDMTMEVFFGHEKYTSAGTWRRTAKGWYMWLK